ncbi:MAG: glycoside hydrolase family 172 protein, partial [Acidobacteriota bacterium]
SASLGPSQAFSLEIPGTAVIRQMRLQLEPPTPEILASLRLRMAWDESPFDSVDTPVGYFFGHVFGGYGKTLESPAAVIDRDAPSDFNPPLVKYTSRFNSLILGVTETEACCRFPMPFSNGARVTLVNTGKENIPTLRLRLDVERLKGIPENWGRFHATWTTSPAASGLSPRFGPQNVPGKVVLERQGRGKYVGVLLSIDWPHLGWWGEGDWLIWTDQEGWPPDYHGTGSEEYFNSGWCRFDRKAISGFVSLRPGHPTVYSFHLNDAFQFQRNIRVVEEQMGDKLIEEEHPLWTSTAFWYGVPAQRAGSD